MTDSLEQPPFAWQPLTRGGVAVFARASTGRLLLVQWVFAALAAASVVWFLQTAWFPVVADAIRQLPAEGQIRSGTLHWAGGSPTPLAERHFLAFSVDLDHGGNQRSPAEIQVEFGRTNYLVLSLLGARSLPYPQGAVIPCGRTELEPLWGAWRPMLLALAGGAVVFALMLTWNVLATLYVLPVYLAGRIARRDLTLLGAWRDLGAALMPGALMMTLGLVAYGLGVFDLVRLGAAFGLHFVAGWGYLAAATLAAPERPPKTEAADNPFKAPAPPTGGG